MASLQLYLPHRYAPGTIVRAYPRDATVANEPPDSNSVDQATVAADGTLTFNNLPDNSYLTVFARVDGDHRYFPFAVGDPSIPTTAPGPAGTGAPVDVVVEQEAFFHDLADGVRGLSVGNQRIAFDDARETIWEDLTGWAQGVAGGVTASGGRIYNATGVSGPPKTAAIALPGGPLAANERMRAVCPIQIAATSGATGTVGFGLTNEAAPNPSGDVTSTHLATFGPNPPGNLAARFGSAGQAAGTFGNAFAAGPATILVEVDEYVISFSLYDANGVHWEGYRLARDAATATALGITQFSGTISGLALVNTDSRGATGHTLGPIGFRREAVSLKTRTAPVSGNAIAGVAPSAFWGALSSVSPADRFAFVSPKGWDSRKQLPVVIQCHGSSRDERNFYEGAGGALGAAQAQFSADLMNAGFGLLLPYYGGNTWGNPYAQDCLLAAYRWARDHRGIGPILLMGLSMGGIAALNLLARRTVPGIRGFYGIYPATNLADIYGLGGGLQTDIKTAYGVAADGSDYATKTAGFDPMLATQDKFRGVRMRFVASPGDTAVPKVTNSDAFAARLAPYVPEATVVAATGPHGDDSHLKSGDAIAFFKRCIGTDVPTDSGTVFLFDSFTDTDGKTLVAHVGENGVTWTASQGAPTILSNRARNGASTGVAEASPLALTADYDVVALFYLNTDDNASSGGIMGRKSAGVNTGYLWRYNANGDKWQLYLWQAGTPTLLGEYVGDALTGAGAVREGRLQLRGTTITGVVDGVSRVSVTDATISAPGRVGAQWSGGTNVHLDSIQAIVV